MIDDYRNRHKGETCAILLNGESVRQFSPSRWSHEVIGTNRSWRISDARYHCVIDVGQMRATPYPFKSDLFVGIDDDEKTTKSKRGLYQEISANETTELRGWTSRYGPEFVKDLNDPVWLPNVGVMALQLAHWMGFREIHFWGLDLYGVKFWDSDWKISQPRARLQDIQ